VGGRNAARISRGRYIGPILAAAVASGLVGVAALAVAPVPGSLISVNPLGASPGVPIQISGTGFDPIASKNHVRFTPVGGGAPQTVPATAIATVDATRGIRRLNVAVPSGLPAGRATLSVINTTTGEISEGLALDVLYLTLPEVAFAAPGATGVKVVMVGSAGTMFTNPTTTRVAFGSGISVRSVVVENAQRLTAVIDVSAAATLGPRSAAVRPPNQSLLAPDAFTVGSAPPNGLPVANANGPYSGTAGQPVSFTSKGSVDPDNDPVTFAWTFGDGGKSSDANPTHTYQSAGSFPVSLTVSDGKGGTATANTTAQIEPPAAQVTGIDADPAFVRFSALETPRALTVIATKSDGTFVDVTAGASGTIYSSSNPFVAAISADGLVTARGNGEATITARNGLFSDTVAVAVEVGVTLTSLDLTPSDSTLRLAGATQPLVLKGTFSDGSVRDLTTAAGTTYRSVDPNVANVSAAGLVAAVASGSTEITASHGEAQASSAITVVISQGQGFLRGAAFDDSRGLPLAGATVMLIGDGGGIVEPPVTTITDDTGRYVLQGRAGDAVVRVQKEGFTAVDRLAVIPASGAGRVFDARLTPVDSRGNAIQSAFGGQARDTAETATLMVPPGSLITDADLRLTPLSAQGLAGLLPPGWSPVAAAEVRPLDTALAQPATLSLANVGSAPASSAVTVAIYDRSAHRWTAAPQGQVSADGRSINISISGGGQFVALLPDAAPHTPPAAMPGDALAGAALVPLPMDVSADGVVVPRAAAPGANARAVGRVGIGGTQSLPSGTGVQVRVTESFELLDASTVAPLPFIQDILVHARPRPPTGGSLGATFPITPSRTYTIQELMRGVVTLDVTRPSDLVGGSVAGPQGAVVNSPEGDSLIVPAGAFGAETLVELRRVVPPSDIPATFTPVAAFEIDLIGVSLTLPGRLSTPVPAGVTAADQILLVQSFIDPIGIRRTRVAGTGRIEADRLVSDHVLGTLAFPGVTSAGGYYFLKTTEPLGFVTGIVTGDGGTPAPLALVTSSSAPFVDVTGAMGRYVVAARAATDAIIAARHLSSSDAATGTAHPSARDAVVVLPLTLTVAPPSVVATSPAAGATNVALDTSVTIDFSEPIDPSSVSESSVSLQTSGAPISVSRTLSQDRRRLTVRPESPLLGKTTYTLSLTSALKDLSGAALVAFAPLTFTTLDPTKPPQPPPGQIVAQLPDEDGLVLVSGAAGTTEGSTHISATNLRTQETVTVLSLVDGSFRLRITALLGDEIALTLRDSSGRQTTVVLNQFDGADGSRALGPAGGAFEDSSGRRGSLLPRTLVTAGTFKFETVSSADPDVSLTAPYSYVDRFDLRVDGAAFNRLARLILSEAQGRFAPVTALGAPFESSAEFTIPADFLLNSAIRFTATAEDALGARRVITGSTEVVASAADTSAVERGALADFPTLFVTAPREGLQNQVITVRASAPDARIDLEVPSANSAASFLLARVVEFAGGVRLALVDTMTRVESNGGSVLRSSSRTLPGITGSGSYAVIAASDAPVFITGQLVGAAGVVAIDGSPFIFETTAPNGRFMLPVSPGQPFVLTFFNADGSVRGTTTGTAPEAGSLDVGDPLNISAGQLLVAGEPDENSIVDVGAPLVLRFSEPVDPRSLSAGVVVTGPAGARVFGRFFSTADARTVEFRPLRRWRYGARYNYTVGTSVLSVSGAKLVQPFSRTFTTFAPAVLATAAAGSSVDVTVSGSLAVLGTSTGMSVVDVSSPATPRIGSSVTIPGGGRAVAIVPAGTLMDRDGETYPGAVAVVVSGDPTAGVRLDLFDLSTAGLLHAGGAQLTVPPGQSAPPGVLAAGGTPRQVLVTGSRALIALENVGLLSVDLSLALGSDPVTGEPLQGRFPVDAFENVTGVAMLGDRVLLAGSSGLTILDALTLQRRGGLNTGTALRSVHGLPAFSLDVDGDGFIGGLETLDLAIATDGSHGNVQIFRIPATGDPELLSIVRFTGETLGVSVDASERLAYIGLGAHGIGMVDLDGPVSVQPLDHDRDGLDDRILAVVASAGAAQRLALQLGRGIGHAADGTGGLTVLQINPPRTIIETLLRDPISAMTGDEQSILQSRKALTTDEELQLEVFATVPPTHELFLVLQETRVDGGPRRLSFADGSTLKRLNDGTNSIRITIARAGIQGASDVTLRIQNGAGALVRRLDLQIAPVEFDETHLRSLRFVPRTPTIGPAVQEIQLAVAGVLTDGTVVNLTVAETGTTYVSGEPRVAAIGPDGLVVAVAGGRTEIVANHRGRIAADVLTIQHPPIPLRLEAAAPFVTLTAPDARATIDVSAHLSDGTTVNAATLSGTSFSSSAPSVVAVDQTGVLTAHAEGTATIAVTNGPLTTEVSVAAEFRTTPTLTGIQLSPIPGPITTDTAEVELQAKVSGSGSLEGLTVSFSLSPGSGPAATGITHHSGIATSVLTGLTTPGTFTLIASVVSPLGGQTFSDTTTLIVGPGSGDNEPNNGTGNASRLSEGQTVSGTLDGATDTADTYRIDVTAEGTLTVTLTLGTGATGVALVLRDANGVEIARFTPTGTSSTFAVPLTASGGFLSIEGGGAVTYSLSSTFVQGNITVTSVAPLSGGPGTLVRIDGTGFSTDLEETLVRFGGVEGRVTTVTPTRIEVLVPANGVNGPVEVVSGARSATGPVFTTGTAVLPDLFITPGNNAALRFDPDAGVVIDVGRLWVRFDPLVTRVEVQAFVKELGGAVVGEDPSLNMFAFEFASNQTIAGIDALHARVEADARVLYATFRTLGSLDGRPLDGRRLGKIVPGTLRPSTIAYDRARIFEAIDAVRNTPPFSRDNPTFEPTFVAVLDTGFDPHSRQDFERNSTRAVEAFTFNYATRQWDTPPSGYRDPAGHGTIVASVIGALNEGQGELTGVLNGLVQPGETAPFNIAVFEMLRAADIDIDLEFAAIRTIDLLNRAGTPTHVANLSYSWDYNADTLRFRRHRRYYRDLLRPLRARTLVVTSASNEGVDARFTLPASLAATQPHIVSVAATAVIDEDGNGPEAPDARAIFGGPSLSRAPRCGSAAIKGSNCGNTVTLAAPGHSVYAAQKAGSATPYAFADGTSLAAPLVAGVAGMLQAIRKAGPTAIALGDPIPPDRLKNLLVSTADDITGIWSPGAMKRLNALAAVRALLVPPEKQPVYVADNDMPNPEGPPGLVVALTVDPFTGERISGALDEPIRLAVNGFSGTAPTQMIVDPAGDKLYVAVTADEPALGGGVLVVNTHDYSAERFIAFSGATAPGASPGSFSPLPAIISGRRMVFSKDGRLLYVAVGLEIVVVNTVDGIVVSSFRDLPGPYNLNADLPTDTLKDRRNTLRTSLASAPPSGTGVEISGLDMSPDGRVLYAAVRSGGGGGSQPGGVIAIDVDLYRDVVGFGSKSDLTRYFKTIGSALRISDPAVPEGGDEPSGVTVSPDGKHVYLVNGGLQFLTTTTTQLDLNQFEQIIGPVPQVSQVVGEETRLEIQRQATSGETIVGAPGWTGVFTAASSSSAASQAWLFRSDIVFGWDPEPENGGLIVNHITFPEVFASRPYGMTMRPDGKRAIVPLFQSGNFGVLDLEAQQHFQRPGIGSLPATLFSGVAGVTEALKLDRFLWPRRGAFVSKTGQKVPSPDEALLFPTFVEYSQNGHFAVSAHAGAGPPEDIVATIPDDCASDLFVRAALLELGFDCNSSLPNPLKRGGGAVSIIKDAQITADFAQHASQLVSAENQTIRPYFATLPITSDAVTRLLTFDAGSGDEQFHEPRGVTIQPFVTIESPRWGDRVTRRTGVQVRWRDAGVTHVKVRVLQVSSSGDLTQQGTEETLELEPDERARRTANLTVDDLFLTTTSAPPPPATRYRLELAVLNGTRELSRTQVEVVLER
jgi:PKD repeat protein